MAAHCPTASVPSLDLIEVTTITKHSIEMCNPHAVVAVSIKLLAPGTPSHLRSERGRHSPIAQHGRGADLDALQNEIFGQCLNQRVQSWVTFETFTKSLFVGLCNQPLESGMT
jgi:hypothetical protein